MCLSFDYSESYVDLRLYESRYCFLSVSEEGGNLKYLQMGSSLVREYSSLTDGLVRYLDLSDPPSLLRAPVYQSLLP